MSAWLSKRKSEKRNRPVNFIGLYMLSYDSVHSENFYNN